MNLTERRAARRYSHQVISYRRCHSWSCLPCWWRTLTGHHRRVKAELTARGNEQVARTNACEHEWLIVIRSGREIPHCDKCGTIRWQRRRVAS